MSRCARKSKLRRSGTRGLKHVVRLATVFSKVKEKDMQVYKEGLFEGKPLYNFMEYNPLKPNIIKIIKWQEAEQKI